MDAVRWQPESPEAPLPGCLRLLDQTKLPLERTYIELTEVEDTFAAIQRLSVRGAPAIGIAAAYGLVAAMQKHQNQSPADFITKAAAIADRLNDSRPTAVNLKWALDRCLAKIANSARSTSSELLLVLWQEADAIYHEDLRLCRAIGVHGASLIQPGMGVLTHCNAGALATSDYGTALAPMYRAAELGTDFTIYSCETRPLLQGSRLTAWELQQAGLAPVVICDNMAAALMQEETVQLVITGADRIAANGDAANKIGTLSHAIAAKHFGIPFYVAAPYSTFDLACPSGSDIPIEERAAAEIIHGFGRRTAPDGVRTRSPAFDVTPANLIAGFITDKGILQPPFNK